MKCTTCDREYSPDCDWQQGRCPHHPPLLNIQPRDTSPGHFYVSLVKSAIRIAAGIALIWPQNIVLAGVFLIAAEVLGVVEEVV
jgi:hypothetical protein